MIAKPNFHSSSIFAENLIAIELRKLEVKFNKPIYVDTRHIESLLVQILLRVHVIDVPRQCKIAKCKITSTWKVIYHIECDDTYETMKRDIARFDASDYLEDNVYDMPLVNKIVRPDEE